jgi:hypothetical protein
VTEQESDRYGKASTVPMFAKKKKARLAAGLPFFGARDSGLVPAITLAR